MVKNFKTLDIWSRSRVLVKEVYSILESFPKSENYGLISQLKRAVISVPSNISEGCGRRTLKDLSHFLDVAIGSLCEVETQLYLAYDLGFISQSKMEELVNETTQIRKMITGFQNSLS